MDIQNTQGMKWRTNLKGGGTCHMLLMLSIASILKLRNHLALEACIIITKASLAQSSWRQLMQTISLSGVTWGYMPDCQIFDNSECMYTTSNSFPQPSPITNDDRDMPFFIVGDDAFPIMTNTMNPYKRQHLSHSQNIFNDRLSRDKRIV